MNISETPTETISRLLVSEMSIEQLKQAVYDDLVALAEHASEDLLLANFWSLSEASQTNVRLEHPNFDTGE